MPDPIQRRGFLRSLLGIVPAAVLSQPSDDDELLRLERELTKVHVTRWSGVDETQDERLYARHWELRQRINGLPAAGPAGLKVKSRAAEFALFWDDDCDCRGPGSFVDLTRSMIADINRI
jgi:hypothetical protein